MKPLQMPDTYLEGVLKHPLGLLKKPSLQIAHTAVNISAKFGSHAWRVELTSGA